MKLALTGEARSGKDTLAAMVNRLAGGELKTYALAYPIKKVINTLVGVTAEVAENTKDLNISYSITYSSQKKAALVFQKLTEGFEDYFPEFYEFWDMLENLVTYDSLRMSFQYNGSIRFLYQIFGTEFGRSVNDQAWLRIAPKDAIITDVRFNNEAEWFGKLGYHVVKVLRDTKGYNIGAKHISENGVNNRLVSELIDNYGTLEDLEIKAKLLIAKLPK